MARNRKFEVEYIINVKGITTNEFMLNMIRDILETTVKVINIQYKQVNAEITEVIEKK